MTDIGISVIVVSTAIFLAMVINLVAKPSFTSKVTGYCMVIAVVGGLLIYGIGYAEKTGDLLLSVIRTPFSVIGMFVGRNDMAMIEGTAPVRSTGGQTALWILNLLAFYSMASAAMVTIGAAALRSLRLALSARGDLVLIYGISPDSIALGKECLREERASVLLVDDNATPAEVTDINRAGMSVVVGQAAVNSEKSFLRRLRLKKRKLEVYALKSSEDQNLFYAVRLKDALKEEGIPPENTRVTLAGAEEIIAAMLQATDTEYGFGFVNVYDRPMLAARAMIQTCPPWEWIRFDETGRATEDYSCVIVGFGEHGQAALKQLVMNGQFAGSRFSAAVFSPNADREAGYLLAESPELQERYDIRYYQADGRSEAFIRYIGENLESIRLIALCTGSEEMNREISDHLMLYLQRRHAEQICVIRCGEKGVRYQEYVGSPVISKPLCCRAMLSAEEADRSAILLNSTYDDSDRTDWEKWLACDSFSKMSSRASADFAPAFIRASGSSREKILNGDWKPSEQMLTTLGETEHLRWCAFHTVMGYRPMSDEEFRERADRYRGECEAGKTPTFKIGKNPEGRTHACLIPWEELDGLSARENAVTGRNVDYSRMDINNVLTLPRLLEAEERAKERTKGAKK